MTEEEQKVFEEFELEGKTVLDVGCGDGRFSDFFSEHCKKYVGIDVSEECIKSNIANNTKENVSYVYENIINYKPEEKFDYIVMSLALHEFDIEQQGVALLNVLNLLTNDGKVIILDPVICDYSFQAIWNIAFDVLKLYIHDYSVKHSQEVIKKVVNENLCKITKQYVIEIPFKFKDIDEVYDMFVNSSDLKIGNWSDANKKKLYDKLSEFLKEKEDITLYDVLDVTVLEKGNN